MTAQPLFALQQASKHFSVPVRVADTMLRWWKRTPPSSTRVHAVRDVSFTLDAGEIIGLVGESGCGKSTLGRMVVGLHGLNSGSRWWKGQELPDGCSQLGMQMIFQDAYASLHPRMRVNQIIGEAPVVHGLWAQTEADERVAGLLQQVGLEAGTMRRFPHQFSGGQRARIGIARALAVGPELLVCDEAVAALDASVQAQILNLLLTFRQELGVACLFISHDLGVVRFVADRVLIMYLGRIVESAPAETLFAQPNHPYTQALLAEAPSLDVRKKTFVAIRGELPSPLDPPAGCAFHPRCPYAMPRCRDVSPPLLEIAPGHRSACHLNGV